jgi:hypothetical protein
MEGIFDEFALEQRQPLDSSTTTTSSASSLSMSSASIHSQVSASNHSSTYSSHSTISIASNYSSTSMFSSSMLFTTKTEDEQLSFAMTRINEAYSEYIRMHKTYAQSIHNKEQLNGSMVRPGNSNISHDELLMCFREVPEVFFRPEFSLQNVDIFNLAMGTKFASPTHSNAADSSNNTVSSSGRKLISSSHQQEQLTKYLDIIELALLNNIWIRSPSFFKVLDDIRNLQTLVSTGHGHVISLRQKYQASSERISTTVLRIPKLHVRQRNENVLNDKLMFMQRVMLGKSAIAAMVEVEDYLSALEVCAVLKYNVTYLTL